MINFLPKKKKKRKLGKFFLILLILLFAVFIYYSYTLNAPGHGSNQTKEFIVEAGQGSAAIGQQLQEQSFISSRLVFQFYVWREGISGKLKSGQYFLAPNLSIKQVAEILYSGPGQTREKTLTIIEGWDINDIAKYLDSQGVTRPEDFLATVQKKQVWWDEYEILNDKPRSLDLEGYLFPDTYRIFSDATVPGIVRKFLDNLEKKLTPQLQAEIEGQGKTINEILTLASIIEKEVSSDQDRKMVADIFYKRINAGIALQADSTVNYATGKSTPRASAQDLQVDSLYNTYKYRGLPPGPISNPGLSAILAAIYPTANPYWYFLTTPSGEVVYSKTFEEHIAAKTKYYR